MHLKGLEMGADTNTKDWVLTLQPQDSNYWDDPKSTRESVDEGKQWASSQLLCEWKTLSVKTLEGNAQLVMARKVRSALNGEN